MKVTNSISSSSSDELEAAIERVLNRPDGLESAIERVLNKRLTDGHSPVKLQHDPTPSTISLPSNIIINDVDKPTEYSKDMKEDAPDELGQKPPPKAALKLEKENMDLKLKFEEQSKEISNLKEASWDYGIERAYLESKLLKQRDENRELEQKLISENASKETAEKEKAILSSELSEMENKVVYQRKELAILNQKVQDIHAKEEENRILRDKIEEQSKKIERQSTELAMLNAKVQTMNTKEKEKKIAKAKLGQQIKIEETTKIDRQKKELAAEWKLKEQKICKTFRAMGCTSFYSLIKNPVLRVEGGWRCYCGEHFISNAGS